MLDDRQHVRAQYFDGDFVSPVGCMQSGEMDLSDRCRGDRRRVEFGKNFAGRPAIGHFDFGQCEVGGERRNAILQLGQFVSDVHGHEVAPGRQHLAELDEYRPERFKGEAQTNSAWCRQVAPELKGIGKPHQTAARLMFEHHLVEAEAAGDGGDLEQTKEAHVDCKRRPGRAKSLNEHVNTPTAVAPRRFATD